jgi:hypothetical protein
MQPEFHTWNFVLKLQQTDLSRSARHLKSSIFLNYSPKREDRIGKLVMMGMLDMDIVYYT